MTAADQAVALDTRSSLVFVVRGFLKGRAGKYDDAIADYSEAIRLSPSFELPYKARAGAYAKLGKRKEAATDDKTVALLSQGSVDALVAPPLPPEVAKALAAPALDDVALTKLFSAKTWEARQGLGCHARISRRRHVSAARERISPGSRSKCVRRRLGSFARRIVPHTNVGLCLTGHETDGNIALTRAEIVGSHAARKARRRRIARIFGAADKFADLEADAVSDPVTEFPVDEVFLPGPPASPGVQRRFSTTARV